MRAVFYVYLCLLLFCAVRPLYSSVQVSNNYSSSARGSGKKSQLKVNTSIPGDTVLDDKDDDKDDDNLRDHDDDAGAQKFLSIKYSLAFAGNLTCEVQMLSTHYNKRFRILPPFCGNSAPIYITQRVLRV